MIELGREFEHGGETWRIFMYSKRTENYTARPIDREGPFIHKTFTAKEIERTKEN